jgi:hypothetical protein
MLCTLPKRGSVRFCFFRRRGGNRFLCHVLGSRRGGEGDAVLSSKPKRLVKQPVACLKFQRVGIHFEVALDKKTQRLLLWIGERDIRAVLRNLRPRRHKLPQSGDVGVDVFFLAVVAETQIESQ